jgi:uncharacterized protein YjiS (DUF1127 family)
MTMLDVLKPTSLDFAPSANTMRGLAGQAAKTVVHWLTWPMRALEARRVLNQLASLDDRGLADIGLNRSDVANAAAVPVDDDPTFMLALARRERQFARDAAREAWRTVD